MDPNRITAYLALLKIRRRAARRDAIIAGAAFVLFLGLFFLLGMTGQLINLGVWAASAMVLSLGLGSIFTLTRLETIKAVSELAEHLVQIDQSA